MDGHLGAGVEPQGGKTLPGQPQDAQILHQHAVGPQRRQLFQQRQHPRQLPVLHQGVHRHINPHPVQMGKAQGLRQGFVVKIAGAGPGAEGRVAQIDRVRSRRLRPLQGLPVSRRGENLHAFLSFLTSPEPPGPGASWW